MNKRCPCWLEVGGSPRLTAGVTACKPSGLAGAPRGATLSVAQVDNRSPREAVSKEALVVLKVAAGGPVLKRLPISGARHAARTPPGVL